MGNRVERIRTVVSVPQMVQAITESWNDLFHTVPSKEQISMVLAQNALETGHRKSMWNFNIGNLTTNGKGMYDFYDDLATSEQIQPGIWKKMNLKYRAYPTLKEGVKDYLKFIGENKKYASAWKHILNPDPIAFSKALKSAGYYTANEKPYTKTLTKLYNQFVQSKNINQEVSPSIPAINKTTVLENILNNYLQMVAASKNNKKIYKKILPTHNILIRIGSSEYSYAIEFARILCTALEEELVASAYTHTNNKIVEIECAIQGPQKECFNTVQQLTNTLCGVFKTATYKIGGIQINTSCIIDKKSEYKQICLKTAKLQYRKFLLKFIQG